MAFPSQEFVDLVTERMLGDEVTGVEGCEDGGVRLYLGSGKWIRFYASEAFAGEVPERIFALTVSVPIEEVRSRREVEAADRVRQ